MVELADTLALGASAARHAGSSPVPGTNSLLIASLLRGPERRAFLFLDGTPYDLCIRFTI